MTLNDYKKEAQLNRRKSFLTTHMELIIKENLNVDLGDTIYYVNTGTKNHWNIKLKQIKKR